MWACSLSALVPHFSKVPRNSLPERKLYQEIKKETLVSLRQIYRAVLEKNVADSYKVQQAGKIHSEKLAVIVGEIKKEVELQKKRCKSGKVKGNDLCFLQTRDLQKQLEFFQNLAKPAKGQSHLNLYKATVAIAYITRYEVLKEPYQKWSKKCPMKKINTLPCKMLFFETDIFYSILQELSQAAYAMAIKEKPAVDKENLNRLIARYE